MDRTFIGTLLVGALIIALTIGAAVGFNRCASAEMVREGTACVESGGQYVCSRYSCVCLSAKK
jgi:hypothetical protein